MKRVTFNRLCFAKLMARFLFMVENPPLDEPHSTARRVTFNAQSDPLQWLDEGKLCELMLLDLLLSRASPEVYCTSI